jgi:hypothetical protein
LPLLNNRVRYGRSSATNGPKRRQWSILQSSDRTESLQVLKPCVFADGVEGPQLRDRLPTVGDYERPALTNLLQVPAESSLQFTGTNGRASNHVVMMTTPAQVVNRQSLGTASPAPRRVGNAHPATQWTARKNPVLKIGLDQASAHWMISAGVNASGRGRDARRVDCSSCEAREVPQVWRLKPPRGLLPVL